MDIADLIEAKRRSRLDAYRVARSDIREHAGIEETVLAGGYGYRQVLELVQNGADAILEESEQTPDAQGRTRIEVILHEHHLYVANTGAPLSEEGVEALLQSHSSPKRGNQIGRFGLGFKSLLRLGGQLDIFSTSGSLRFDPKRCQSEIRREFNLPEDAPAAGLRLAWTLKRNGEECSDAILAGFGWATTVVRAEIGDANMLVHLRDEIQQFPSPFLLFLPVAISLDLYAGNGNKRQLRRDPDGSDTPSSARRYFVNRFQSGEIRVLCNRDVLTTGFDAPKTDMVLIARQVMSPVRYMQMVGRGLRGEKNGGTARCRIATVVENLGRFSDRHPFHYCAQYFR